MACVALQVIFLELQGMPVEKKEKYEMRSSTKIF